jgi:hypothetical protein
MRVGMDAVDGDAEATQAARDLMAVIAWTDYDRGHRGIYPDWSSRSGLRRLCILL